MKKLYFLAMLACMLVVPSAFSQQIAVVASGGTTRVYQTLKAAIEGASDGSVIYMPGGGFSIGDSVKITKRVTIVGIGHVARNSDNADGATIINGNLWFNAGSSGSTIMGCYVSGNVKIGDDGVVDNMLVKLCNVNGVEIRNVGCSGTIANQNYIRDCYWGAGSSDNTISNNVINRIERIGSGTIKNNVFCIGGYNTTLEYVDNCLIEENILNFSQYLHRGNNCQVINNLRFGGNWGDDPVVIEQSDANLVFKNLNGWAVNPVSDFHFADDYKEYESQVGIYAGTGFSGTNLPPVPYIVAKRIATETDAEGKLKVQIRVNAGE